MKNSRSGMSEDGYLHLFESASIGIILLNASGEIFAVNRAYAQTHGYTQDEMLGMKPSDLDTPTSALAFPERLRRLQAGECLTFEVENYHKDGHVVHLEVCASRVTIGTESYYQSFVQDISERKHAKQEMAMLEAQLQQASKMESIGRLAGGVAHDFNNMLGVILGRVELALEKLEPTHPLHAELTEINSAAQRSAELTQQLLTFARKQTIAPKVLSLNETVTGMLKMLQRLIGENILLQWNPQTSLWPVNIDPNQIDQILANLCINARDAIASAGCITIETTNYTVREENSAMHPGITPGDYVRLVVTDTGCGMEPETMAHLFEPFFTTKGIGKGTGLGLSSVYGAVKQNHGFITATSAVGQGTVFTIYLPRHLGPAEIAPADAADTPDFHGTETILLVEDEPALLKLITKMLTMHGYTVLATHTPAEAIRVMAESAKPRHLLITDVIMPGMNGRDLAQQLHASQPDLKCLFMSGYTSNVIAHHGVLEEEYDFIQKPFQAKALAAKVRHVLDTPQKRFHT